MFHHLRAPLAPPPSVLWTYPADGAVDVPLDAALCLASNVASFGRVPSVELNGAALAAPAAAPKGLSAFLVEPPRLTPNTPYVWKLSYPAADGAEPASAQGAGSGGCRVAALDGPLHSGWVLVLAGH